MGRSPPDPIAIMRGHENSINAISFLNSKFNTFVNNESCFTENLHALSGDSGGHLMGWNISNRRHVFMISAHQNSCGGLLNIESDLFNKNHFITQGREGLVKIWDYTSLTFPIHVISTGSIGFAKFSSLQCNNNNINNLIFKDSILLPTNDMSIASLYDIKSKRHTFQLNTRNKQEIGPCMTLNMFTNQDKEYAAIGYEQGKFIIFNLTAGGKEYMSANITNDPIISCCIYNDGQKCIIGTAGNDIISFDINYNKNKIENIKPFFHCNHEGIQTICIRNDQSIIATGGWDYKIRIFQANKLRQIAILKYHNEAVDCIKFSPDSRFLLSGARDTKLALWSIYPPN